MLSGCVNDPVRPDDFEYDDSNPSEAESSSQTETIVKSETVGITEILQQYLEQSEAPKGLLNEQAVSSEKKITVVKDDNLWDIAREVYGNETYYTHIYEANRRLIGDDPNLIDIGQMFNIPYIIAGKPCVLERKTLPINQTSIALPSSFMETTEDTADRKAMFDHSDRHIVFSDVDSQVEFTLFSINEKLTADNIFAFTAMQKDILASRTPAISSISQVDAVARGDTKTAYFDYILQENGADSFNLVFMTPVVDKVFAGVLSCPVETSEDWRPVMYEVMRSIPEPETPADQWGRGPVNNVSHTGEWEIHVWGNKKVAEGLGGMPWQNVFYDDAASAPRASTLLTVALPVIGTMEPFYEDWPATVEAMTKTLQDMAGENVVDSVSYDEIQSPDGNTYVLSFELRFVPVTMAWRFCQSYYVFAMGVDLGDMPDMGKITIDAARDFKDYTSEPRSGWQSTIWDERPGEDVPRWDHYPVHNAFWPLWTYFYEQEGVFNPYERIPEAPLTLETPYNWGDQTLKPADEAIPTVDIFWERYNKAAGELGIPIAEISKYDGLTGNALTADGTDIGAIYYDPLHIMLMMYGDSERERLLVYAATAAAVTGLSAEESLHAMSDLVYNAAYNVWENGHQVYENTVALKGVPFNYHIVAVDDQRATPIGVLGVNYDQDRRRLEKEAED